jgi:hypothetical protein
MAALDEEYLRGLRNQALEQRQKYLDLVQQANGAIAMVDVLLTEISRMDPPDLQTQSTKTGEMT